MTRCHDLQYLDDRPITIDERRRCNTWGNVLSLGGTYNEAHAAERSEMKQIKKDREQREERNHKQFRDWAAEGEGLRHGECQTLSKVCNDCLSVSPRVTSEIPPVDIDPNCFSQKTGVKWHPVNTGDTESHQSSVENSDTNEKIKGKNDPMLLCTVTPNLGRNNLNGAGAASIKLDVHRKEKKIGGASHTPTEEIASRDHDMSIIRDVDETPLPPPPPKIMGKGTSIDSALLEFKNKMPRECSTDSKTENHFIRKVAHINVGIDLEALD